MPIDCWIAPTHHDHKPALFFLDFDRQACSTTCLFLAKKISDGHRKYSAVCGLLYKESSSGINLVNLILVVVRQLGQEFMFA